ncbi:hypothetical protein ACKWTF_006762 [Chironomus riparius]
MNHFNKLPDELINKIYSYLDIQSIKNFSLTFRRSAAVLASSSYLLNKYFKIKLDGDFWTNREKVLDVMYFKRYMNELDIADIDGNHNVLCALFKKYGCQIMKLKISNSKIDDFTFREILKYCPALKELQLAEVSVIKKLPAINPVCMTDLKVLSVIYCDWEIFKFFTRSQVKSLIIKSYLDEGNRKDLVRYLSFQRKLKEMTLHGTALRTLFQNNDVLGNCLYNLHSLRIDNGIGKNSDIVNLNIITFVNLMDDSLNNVEICGPHNEEMTIFSLLHLENVRSLVIDVRGLPKSREFYQQLENDPKNPNLDSLKLVGFFFQQEYAIKSILLKYPMIRDLEIYDWGNGPISNLLVFISQNLPYLRNLKITEITNNENIKLNALQNLTVQYIRNARKLTNFIVRNNSVETLNIGLVYIGQVTEFANDLKDLNSVKHLSIGGNKTALRKLLTLIHQEKPEKLETLELSLVCEEKNASQKSIKMKLPFDPFDLNMKFKVLI